MSGEGNQGATLDIHSSLVLVQTRLSQCENCPFYHGVVKVFWGKLLYFRRGPLFARENYPNQKQRAHLLDVAQSMK
jgi:hypothetical protein